MVVGDTNQLGKYQILEELGKGGFATVYRAMDTTLGREVALKVLAPLLMQDETWVAYFRREARAVAALDHPHIVTIYEIDEVDGRLLIAMKLLEGPTLAQRIADRGPLPWEEILRVLAEIASALDYAHSQGILHRDLKPGNIVLTEQGAVLTDFGFARLVGESSISTSVSGGLVGTPAYIAPELWHNQPASIASDLYALGCILYEMLTGERAFKGDTPPAVMMAHFQPLQMPRSWPNRVAGDIETVLGKALSKEPGERYGSAGELTRALVTLDTRQMQIERPPAASVPPAAEQVESGRRLPKWVWGVVAVIAIMGLLSILVVTGGMAVWLSGIFGGTEIPSSTREIAEEPTPFLPAASLPVVTDVVSTDVIFPTTIVATSIVSPTDALLPTTVLTDVPTDMATVTPFGGGGRVAYVSFRDGNAEIYVMAEDDIASVRLTNNPEIDDWPAWSLDGTKIAFTRYSTGKPDVFVMNADGSAQVNLTNNADWDSSPSWSPDGSKIVFSSNRVGGVLQIWVMSADGSRVSQLTDTSELNNSPNWSPDGSHIAFESMRDGQREIYVMNADSTGQTRLTFTGNNYSPKWSPDGALIVFSHSDGIWRMKADGTNLMQLTTNAGPLIFDLHPDWSPDGTQIIFDSKRDGNSDLWVVGSDGTGLKKLTTNSAHDLNPDWR